MCTSVVMGSHPQSDALLFCAALHICNLLCVSLSCTYDCLSESNCILSGIQQQLWNARLLYVVLYPMKTVFVNQMLVVLLLVTD